jgi:hypothetical protein
MAQTPKLHGYAAQEGQCSNVAVMDLALPKTTSIATAETATARRRWQRPQPKQSEHLANEQPASGAWTPGLPTTMSLVVGNLGVTPNKAFILFRLAEVAHDNRSIIIMR